jgi:hypothetical protein
LLCYFFQTSDDLQESDARLRMERNEKLAIIRTHQIKFDVNEQAGRDLFKTFMMEGMSVAFA